MELVKRMGPSLHRTPQGMQEEEASSTGPHPGFLGHVLQTQRRAATCATCLSASSRPCSYSPAVAALACLQGEVDSGTRRKRQQHFGDVQLGRHHGNGQEKEGKQPKQPPGCRRRYCHPCSEGSFARQRVQLPGLGCPPATG